MKIIRGKCKRIFEISEQLDHEMQLLLVERRSQHAKCANNVVLNFSDPIQLKATEARHDISNRYNDDLAKGDYSCSTDEKVTYRNGSLEKVIPSRVLVSNGTVPGDGKVHL